MKMHKIILSPHWHHCTQYGMSEIFHTTSEVRQAGGRGYESARQCLPIHNPAPLIVAITMTLNWSSAAVSE